MRAPAARWALGLALVAQVAQAQVTEESAAWFSVFTQGRLGGPFLFWFDVHARLNATGGTVSTLTRPGLGLRVRDDMVVWAGYGWTPVFRDGAVAIDEHRLWQQWTWDVALPWGARLQLRSRLEERAAGGDVGLRLRQFVRVQSPWLGGGPLLLALWDEAFLAFNDTAFGQQAGFDQNRLFLGVGLRLGEGVRLEAGYFSQLLVRRDAPDPWRHVAAVNVFVTQ